MALRRALGKTKQNARKARAAVARNRGRRAELVIITGLSGSGKASVLKAFEDLGYHCVDNLPFDLIPQFAEMCQRPGSKFEKAAAVVDIRGGEALSLLPTQYAAISRNKMLRPSLVFLE